MMSVEDNEKLTHTNCKTYMGEYLRSFWIPAMVLTEVPDRDEAPVRLRLLGEDLGISVALAGAQGSTHEHPDVTLRRSQGPQRSWHEPRRRASSP